MRWTRERPTQPGWYWWRHSSASTPWIARVNDGLEVGAINEALTVSEVDHVDECGGEWCAIPLPPKETTT
jgi:hypothetical protein